MDDTMRTDAAMPNGRNGATTLPTSGDWFTPGGIYLLTGGGGALAGHLATHILDKGPAVVALLARRDIPAPHPGVVTIKADVTDRAALAAALGRLRATHGPIDGVFHLAAVTDDRAMLNKGFADFDAVLAPKILGVRNLDLETRDDPLRVFVGFSSVAAVVGNPGQADYATGNAFIDHYMHWREKEVLNARARGLSLSINWPYWREGGLHPSGSVDSVGGHSSGAAPLTLEEGFAALDRICAMNENQVAVFFGDREKFERWLAKPSETTVEPDPVRPEAPAHVLANDADPLLALIGILRREVADILRFDVSDIDDSAPVSELGFDSITYTTLTDRLNQTLGLTLSPPVLLEARDIESIAAGILADAPELADTVLRRTETLPDTSNAQDVSGVSDVSDAQDASNIPNALDVSSEHAPSPEIPAQHRHVDAAIAVVGLHGRFPQSPDLHTFWTLLEENRDAITQVPPGRWRTDGSSKESDSDAPGWGGFVAEIDCFDPLFFGISPREAVWMDPQQRVVLESVWHALEDAGLRRDEIAGSDTGVFVGASSNDYGMLISASGADMSPHRSTGLAHSIISNRVSHVFDLRGPSEAIDTACSSSLVAANRAIRAIREGECALAIVSGVNAMLSPDLFNAFNASGMLSRTGRCHTFDEAADGYVRGEGVGTLILMPMARAMETGLRVRAVVRGAAVNHVGHTNSLTAPSVDAQADLIRSALADAGLGANAIDAVEAHGTGTALGDPIEINGLKAAFGGRGDDAPPLLVTSVKSKIGHLEAAAGIAGIVSAVLALERGRVPGNAQLHRQNPYIELDGTPLSLVRGTCPWPERSGSDGIRRMGVSSFGFGGTNGHIVLESVPVGAVPPAKARRSCPILLSAPTPDALRRFVATLSDRVDADDFALEDLSYSLARHRSHFDCRVAFAVSSSTDMGDALRTFLADPEATISNVGRADLRQRRLWEARFDELLGSAELDADSTTDAVVALYIEGANLDWGRVFEAGAHRFVALPPTPLERERYWFDKGATAQAESWTIALGSDVPLLQDHKVLGKPILSGAGGVVLLMEAATRAGWTGESETRSLADIRWLRPLRPEDTTPELEGRRDGAQVALMRGDTSFVTARLSDGEDHQAVPDWMEGAPSGTGHADDALYARFEAMGLDYGPVYRRIDVLKRTDDRVLARLTPPQAAMEPATMAASALDAALQSAIVFAQGDTDAAVPVRVEKLSIFGDLADCTVVAGGQLSLEAYSFTLLDDSGIKLAVLTGVRFEPLATLATGTVGLYRDVWESAEWGQGQDDSPRTLFSIGDAADAADAPDTRRMTLPKTSSDWEALARSVGLAEGAITVLLDQISADDTTIVELARLAGRLSGRGDAGIVVAPASGSGRFGAVLRSLAAEYGNVWAKEVSLEDGGGPDARRRLAEEARRPETAEIRLDADGNRLERVLVRVDTDVDIDADTPIGEGDVCVIAGGLGGIGRALAASLRRRTGAVIVLLARSEPDEASASWIAADTGLHVVKADLEDATAVDAAFVEIVRRHGKATHVFHLAGRLNDGASAALGIRDLEAAEAPKVGGLANLEQATRASGTRVLVGFSSAAAVFGSAGQIAYAAANERMAELARIPRGESEDRSFRIIDWPLWEKTGMWSDALAVRYRASGLAPLRVEEAVDALFAVLRGESERVQVVKTIAALPERLPLSRRYVPPSPVASTPPVDSEALESWLRGEIADVFGIPETRLRRDEPLERYGLDSALVLELTARLEARYGKLPKTLFFEFPSIEALGGYLASRSVEAVEAETPAPATPVERRPPPDAAKADWTRPDAPVPIAVIGLSGRFPEADDLDAFWRNLMAGRDSTTDIPSDRWNHEMYFDPDRSKPGSVYLGRGGFIDGYDQFDPSFFRIATRDAKRIDPQERLFLQESWKALESAGYPPARLRASTDGKVGVFAGVMWSEYQLHGRSDGAAADWVSLGSSFSSIANRTSYFLDLTGPSMAIDTMCSASLTAIHQACNALKLGECRVAIAGGVNLTVHPNKYILLSQSSFASSDGRCRSFGEGGDGYGPGEGVGVAILKPLDTAIADKDRILGVIRGSAVNHGGAVSGYSVPNPLAQAEVIEDAWRRAGRDPGDADYIEAHGTGTPLGDPIEIRGLAKAFPGMRSLPVGSVKSNIGHLESAAGMAALAKVVCQMEHGKLVPTLHADPPNPDLGMEGTGLHITTTVEPWERRTLEGVEQPYLTGISSFGAGGSNAHLVLEEYIDGAEVVEEGAADRPYPILISGRSQQVLERSMGELRDWLRANPSVALRDVAFTLAVGRARFERRFALVIDSVPALVEALTAILAGRPGADVASSEFLVRQATPDGSNEELLAAASSSDPEQRNAALSSLATAFANGAEPDLAEFFGADRRVIPLPTYPFETRRLWVDPPRHQAPDARPPQRSPVSQVIQPETPLMETGEQPASPPVPAASDRTADDILELLQELLASQLDEDPATLSPDTPFVELGIDSIHAVQIVRTIGEKLGRQVGVAKLYDHPTMRRLAEFLATADGTIRAAEAPRSDTPPTAASNPPADAAASPAAPDSEKVLALAETIRAIIAEVLDEDPLDLPMNRPFQELGLDSVHAVQIARKLGDVGHGVTAATLYEHPTIERIAEHLVVEGVEADAESARPRPDRRAPTVPARAATANGLSIATPAERERLDPSTRTGPVRLSSLDDTPSRERSDSSAPPPTTISAEPPDPAAPAAIPDAAPSLRPGQRRRRAALIRSLDALEHVNYVEDVIDAPGPDLVEIDVVVSSISLSDVMRFRGIYPEMPQFPFAAGVEVAGVVARVGENVRDVAIGDRIGAMMSKTFGGHATVTHAHKDAVFPLADETSFADACSLPSSFLTAYYGLVELGRVSEGETVLVHSAASALGLMTIQLAHDAGATVIATIGDDTKAACLHERGIRNVINYRTEDFHAEVMRLTDRRGVDIVFNMLAPDMIQRGIDCLAEGGRYLEAALGSLRAAPKLDIGSIAGGKAILSIGLRSHLWRSGPQAVRRYLDIMRDLLAQGRIDPLPHTDFAVDDFRDAIAHIQSRRSIGRTLLISEPETRSGEGHIVESTSREQAIAVIGMACRFGEAGDIGEFRAGLEAGRNYVGPVPQSRTALGFGTQAIGSFLPEVDKFDPRFFDISPAEAEWMDPQQRVLLEETWKALEDAGLTAGELAGSRTGVFVGGRPSGYVDSRVPADREEGRLHAFTGGLGSILAGRLSYTYDLRGPSVTVDTACSSGAVALDLAVKSLRSGETDFAIVAGISIGTAPGLSPGETVACRAFDADADGFIIGEGVGVLILEGAEAARRRADRVRGLILASEVNQDGLSNGLLAPNGSSQAELVRAVWDSAGITGDQIGMIEAHGTGTVLGDPIEFAALQRSMARDTQERQFCAIGSVKTNLGHTLAAAGIAGVIKVLLSFEAGKIPRSLHFEQPNPHIDFEASAFFVPTESREWSALSGRRRIAGVSAFGFSGTNAHVVLAEPDPRPARAETGRVGSTLIVLSAKTAAAVEARRRDLADWVERHPDVRLDDLAFTLGPKRTHFPHRRAFVTDDLADCVRWLRSGENDVPEGQGPHHRAARAYASGEEIDWAALLPGGRCEILPLPAYPFERRPCFRPANTAGSTAPGNPPVPPPERNGAVARTLLGEETEDGTGRYIELHLDDRAFYLDDHKVNGRAILPGVMTFDLAYRLGQRLPDLGEGFFVKDIVWIRPCIVDGQAEARLRFAPNTRGGYAVHLLILDGNGTENLCSQATLAPGTAAADRPSIESTLRVAELRRLCPSVHEAAECYRLICDTKIHHGSSLQSIRSLRSGETDCLAELEIPATLNDDEDFALHPSLLDGALQSLVGFAFGRTRGDTYMPFSVDEVRRLRPLGRKALVHLRGRQANAADKYIYDLRLADPDGTVCVAITGFLHRRVPSSRTEPIHPTSLPSGVKGEAYVPIWSKCAPVEQGIHPQRIIVVEDDSAGQTPTFADALADVGHTIVRAGTKPPNGVVPAIPDVAQLLHDGTSPPVLLCPWEVLQPDEPPRIAAFLRLLSAIRNRPDGFPVNLVVLLPESGAQTASKQGLLPLLRTAAQEIPGLRTRTVQMNAVSDFAVRHLDIPLDPVNTEVALDLRLVDTDIGAVSVERREIVQVELPEPSTRTWQRDRGCVLVVGGAGGIGRQVATHAACIWGADVVLTGRRAEDREIAGVLDDLKSHGGRARYAAFDVMDPGAVDRSLTDIRREFGAIGGVIYCAGVLDDRLLANLDIERFRSVAGPKSDGVNILDHATREDDLELFVTMSSLGGLVGNSGQAAYVYGSGVMDALMTRRQAAVADGRARGRSLTLNWPLWADGGMSMDAESERYMRESLGLVPMPGAYALQILDRALAATDPQICVLVGEEARLADFFTPRHVAVVAPTPNDEVSSASVQLSEEALTPSLLSLAAEVSGWNVEDVDIDEELSSFGFDSVMVTALANEINTTFSIQVSPAELFSQPTLRSLSAYLCENHAPSLCTEPNVPLEPNAPIEPDTSAASSTPVSDAGSGVRRPEASTRDIAVIGQAARYPGADTIDEFWRLLAAGKDCIGRVPESRWTGPRFPLDPDHPPLSEWGGFLENITGFEPAFFGISPAEAERMDPQERLFLEVGQATFEDAGYGRARLDAQLDGDVGVFVGVMWSQFQLFSNAETGEFGSNHSSLANRISFHFGLRGPSLALDTMCSSSLTALHLACQSLRAGECAAVLVGGVNLSLHQNKYARLSRNRFASLDGKCHAFGTGGDGYVPGEGVGAVLLRPLEDAVRNGDNVHAVIKGTAVNHGGKTSGFTVPNASAQAQVVSRALRDAAVDPRDITYVEAHGTGTKLGDPIEVKGLSDAFGESVAERCALGSVKTNIGHLEAAAGVASLHKTILQMRHRKIAPSLHAEPPNAEIDFAATPFQVNTALTDWHSSGPLLAGISSFGAGGSNAHAIVAEPPPRAIVPPSRMPRLVMLSARTRASLQSGSAALADFLESEGHSLGLDDIATTLSLGRDQMRFRAAFVCTDVSALPSRLRTLAKGQETDILVGHVRREASVSETLSSGLEADRLHELATAWAVEGTSLAVGDLPGRIVSLPTYRFDRKSYWIDASGYGETKRSATILAADQVMDGDRAERVVRTSDPVSRDHVIAGRHIVPGACVLEIGRAGAESILGTPVRQIEAFSWLAPAELEEEGELRLSVRLDDPADGRHGGRGFGIFDAATDRRLARARIGEATDSVPTRLDLDALRARLDRDIDCGQVYANMLERGYAYGPLFRTLKTLVAGEREALGSLVVPDALIDDADRYLLHPAILDGAFQSVLGILELGERADATMYLPFHVGRIVAERSTGPGPVWVHATLSDRASEQSIRFDLSIADSGGQIVASVTDFTLRALRVPSGEPDRNVEDEKPMVEKIVAERGTEHRLTRAVRDFFVQHLKIPEAELTPDLLLEECGLDSVVMMELLRLAEDSFDVEMSPSDLIEMTTFGDLCSCLEAALPHASKTTPIPVRPSPPETPQTAAAAPNPSSRSASTGVLRGGESRTKKVAIIGMAIRVPQSMNEDDFWDHIVNERDLIVETPAERWDWREYFDSRKGQPGKTYSKWGGFSPMLGAYDLEKFKVAPESAAFMDPQQLLMMELARDAMENAGYRPEEFAGQDTGVVIGAAGRSVSTGNEAFREKSVVVSTIQNMIAARLSDFFDLHGTSYTMDTACSSALVALHNACRMIQAGEATTALAGGTAIFTHAGASVGFSQAQALSDDGRCYAFDKRAKGLVLSEGAGLFLLKDYDQARADGDNIRAVIAGSAVNNDGKTMGLTTPNGDMQSAVIRKALNQSQVDPRTISYLEAHGTGTLLGDPIEIKAATNAYQAHTQDRGFCGVASVKSNVGHMLLAAGVCSVAKVVLSMENRVLPATLHCENPHPRFNFEETPFYPIQQTRPWNPESGVRRAGISSFGFGGTNCHMILEEFDAETVGHTRVRDPLPRTQYERTVVWPQLGTQLPKTPAPPAAAPVAEPMSEEDLLTALQNGEISVERALELHAR